MRLLFKVNLSCGPLDHDIIKLQPFHECHEMPHLNCLQIRYSDDIPVDILPNELKIKCEDTNDEEFPGVKVRSSRIFFGVCLDNRDTTI